MLRNPSKVTYVQFQNYRYTCFIDMNELPKPFTEDPHQVIKQRNKLYSDKNSLEIEYNNTFGNRKKELFQKLSELEKELKSPKFKINYGGYFADPLQNQAAFVEFWGNRSMQEDSMVMAYLPDNHKELSGAKEAYVRDALTNTFAALEAEIKKRSLGLSQGSCGLVGAVYGDTISIANLGDGTAHLVNIQDDGTVTIQLLNNIQKPSDEARKKYIEARGGFVSESFGVARVNGELAVPCAFGDNSLVGKTTGLEVINHVPEIHSYKIPTTGKSFLILGCDGLTEKMEVDKNAELLKKDPNKSVIAKLVNKHQNETPFKLATLLANKGLDLESGDNISTGVISLNPHNNAPFYMGIFDGHGGDRVSDFLYQNFATTFENNLQLSLKNTNLSKINPNIRTIIAEPSQQKSVSTASSKIQTELKIEKKAEPQQPVKIIEPAQISKPIANTENQPKQGTVTKKTNLWPEEGTLEKPKIFIVYFNFFYMANTDPYKTLDFLNDTKDKMVAKTRRQFSPGDKLQHGGGLANFAICNTIEEVETIYKQKNSHPSGGHEFLCRIMECNLSFEQFESYLQKNQTQQIFEKVTQIGVKGDWDPRYQTLPVQYQNGKFVTENQPQKAPVIENKTAPKQKPEPQKDNIPSAQQNIWPKEGTPEKPKVFLVYYCQHNDSNNADLDKVIPFLNTIKDKMIDSSRWNFYSGQPWKISYAPRYSVCTTIDELEKIKSIEQGGTKESIQIFQILECNLSLHQFENYLRTDIEEIFKKVVSIGVKSYPTIPIDFGVETTGNYYSVPVQYQNGEFVTENQPKKAPAIENKIPPKQKSEPQKENIPSSQQNIWPEESTSKAQRIYIVQPETLGTPYTALEFFNLPRGLQKKVRGKELSFSSTNSRRYVVCTTIDEVKAIHEESKKYSQHGGAWILYVCEINLSEKEFKKCYEKTNGAEEIFQKVVSVGIKSGEHGENNQIFPVTYDKDSGKFVETQQLAKSQLAAPQLPESTISSNTTDEQVLNIDPANKNAEWLISSKEKNDFVKTFSDNYSIEILQGITRLELTPDEVNARICAKIFSFYLLSAFANHPHLQGLPLGSEFPQGLKGGFFDKKKVFFSRIHSIIFNYKDEDGDSYILLELGGLNGIEIKNMDTNELEFLQSGRTIIDKTTKKPILSGIEFHPLRNNNFKFMHNGHSAEERAAGKVGEAFSNPFRVQVPYKPAPKTEQKFAATLNELIIQATAQALDHLKNLVAGKPVNEQNKMLQAMGEVSQSTSKSVAQKLGGIALSNISNAAKPQYVPPSAPPVSTHGHSQALVLPSAPEVSQRGQWQPYTPQNLVEPTAPDVSQYSPWQPQQYPPQQGMHPFFQQPVQPSAPGVSVNQQPYYYNPYAIASAPDVSVNIPMNSNKLKTPQIPKDSVKVPQNNNKTKTSQIPESAKKPPQNLTQANKSQGPGATRKKPAPKPPKKVEKAGLFTSIWNSFKGGSGAGSAADYEDYSEEVAKPTPQNTQQVNLYEHIKKVIEDKAPAHYKCPISGKVMENPVYIIMDKKAMKTLIVDQDSLTNIVLGNKAYSDEKNKPLMDAAIGLTKGFNLPLDKDLKKEIDEFKADIFEEEEEKNKSMSYKGPR